MLEPEALPFVLAWHRCGGVGGVGDREKGVAVAQLGRDQPDDERLEGLGGFGLHPRQVRISWGAVVLGQEAPDELCGVKVWLLGGIAGNRGGGGV